LAEKFAGNGGFHVGIGLGQRGDDGHPSEVGGLQSASTHPGAARLAGSTKDNLERGICATGPRQANLRVPIVAVDYCPHAYVLLPTHAGSSTLCCRPSAGVSVAQFVRSYNGGRSGDHLLALASESSDRGSHLALRSLTVCAIDESWVRPHNPIVRWLRVSAVW
jgi:hypothetical protein